jgi:glucose/mannose-6-phosphate isomerase
MEQSILNFTKQFEFEPQIENQENLTDFDHIIFCGMGGSHLAADLLKTIKPGINIYVHKDYNLPPYDEEFMSKSLFVACSYSGNTEETISFADDVINRNLSLVIISQGGELIDVAKAKNIPFIEIPNDGIQPRMAVGYEIIAILKLMGDEELMAQISLLSDKIKPLELKEKAQDILDLIENKILIIYASNRNLHIANNWKIKINETAKMPAFCNVFPELNHNEMQSFDLTPEYQDLFSVIFLFDTEDDVRIQRRMEITKDLYGEKGINTLELNIGVKTREENVFNSIIIADWVALELAKRNNKEPENVPLIEEFKDRMKN